MNCSLGGLDPSHLEHIVNQLASQATFWPFDSWGHAPKPWRHAPQRWSPPVSAGCAGEVKGAAAGAPARTVLGLSRGSFAFQAPETWHAPVSMGLPESLQPFDETRVRAP